MLVIIATGIFWYGLAPVAGAFISRRGWRLFRKRLDTLCLSPVLDYAAFCGDGGIFRFTGEFESFTGGVLWVKNEDLTVPADLAGAHLYALPMPEDESFDPSREIPERIRMNRISTLTAGAKVFVGGLFAPQHQRRRFVSTRENPLLVIFYDGPDRSLMVRAVRAGRHKNEYWNPVTPYALTLGTLSYIIIIFTFLFRPAFQPAALAASIAVFTPLFPLLPPGILLTILYRKLWWQARLFRASRDLARLPLKYLPPGETRGRLLNGESYGWITCKTLTGKIPLLIPGEEPERGENWYVFGAFRGTADSPVPPEDRFAPYGALPGEPGLLVRRYRFRALLLEILSWLILLAGIGINEFFIAMIIYLMS
ncbi:MAG: hypothetical protein LBQ14_06065 [Treponema sp.]|nr:hypothetical protein [Treponema sp.]